MKNRGFGIFCLALCCIGVLSAEGAEAASDTELYAAVEALLRPEGAQEIELRITERIMLSKAVDLTNAQGKTVVITGDSSEQVIGIDGTRGSLFLVGPDVTLKFSHITLQGSDQNDAPAVAIASRGRLILEEGAVIQGNHNRNGAGGGVYAAEDAQVILAGGQISNNAAAFGGGVYVLNGTCTIQAGSITQNTAFFHGGGLYLENGFFSLIDGDITWNTGSADSDVSGGGGGVYLRNARAVVSGGRIAYNQAPAGGGVFVKATRAGGNFAMTGGGITDNAARRGAGIYADVNPLNAADLTISDGVIQGNTAEVSGGGVYVYLGNITVTGAARVAANTARQTGGSGVYVSQGSITLSAGAQVVGNEICLNHYKTAHPSIILIAGDVAGTDTIADIAVQAESIDALTKPILGKAPNYPGALPNTRFLLTRFIPVAEAEPAVRLTGYSINTRGTLIR